ncbi:hypothetical protein [Helicobacter cynogastricus]|uniref:hypothetical protein n=1 Tax=Helicobacter cynogastricus TaxID=329937 RepID=UPI000CF0934C|nr:hypothetical protein [Helicobacter cynogastricus]
MLSLAKITTATCLACQILMADPSDFNAQFKILKQVRLHAPLPFQVLLVQNNQAQIQQILLVDNKSSLRVLLGRDFILPDKKESAQLRSLYKQVVKHNFFIVHHKDFQALIKALPSENTIFLESLSKHPSKEFYFFARGQQDLNLTSIAKLEKLLKEARVYVVLLGALPNEDDTSDSYDAAGYLKGLQAISSTPEKIALLKQWSDQDMSANTDPLKEPFLDRIQENLNLASKFDILKGIEPYLPLLYQIH